MGGTLYLQGVLRKLHTQAASLPQSRRNALKDYARAHTYTLLCLPLHDHRWGDRRRKHTIITLYQQNSKASFAPLLDFAGPRHRALAPQFNSGPSKSLCL